MKGLDALILFVFLSFSCIWTAGCQGPAGPDGDDAVLEDAQSPKITWVSPAPGDTLDGEVTLQVIASDNRGVKRVSFYIAGFEFPYDSLITDYEFPNDLPDSLQGLYIYNWSTINWPQGPYPLVVRARDEARNKVDTPVIIVQLVH